MNKGSDISNYTIEYRILAAVWWYDSEQTRTEMMSIKKKLADRFDVDPPDGRVIKAWSEKLFESGTILDRTRSGRPNERGDYVEEINIAITETPITSTRRLSDELNIPRTTVQRVLKKDLQLKPFKPTKVQYLKPEDLANRANCCQQILQKYDNARLRNKLMFSDECAIYLTQKPYNVVMWSKENPYFWEQVQQYQPKVMVWAAMSENDLIGPFFIDGTEDAGRYQQLLREEFIPQLEQKGLLYSCHFQQDGAPCHTAMETRNYLDTIFPGRWVGKYGPTPWPPRSPDLTSCDNALWGIVKRRVRERKPETVADIKAAVTLAFEAINADLLQRIHVRTFRRLRLCIDKGGLQVDPFDN